MILQSDADTSISILYPGFQPFSYGPEVRSPRFFRKSTQQKMSFTKLESQAVQSCAAAGGPSSAGDSVWGADTGGGPVCADSPWPRKSRP